MSEVVPVAVAANLGLGSSLSAWEHVREFWKFQIRRAGMSRLLNVYTCVLSLPNLQRSLIRLPFTTPGISQCFEMTDWTYALFVHPHGPNGVIEVSFGFHQALDPGLMLDRQRHQPHPQARKELDRMCHHLILQFPHVKIWYNLDFTPNTML